MNYNKIRQILIIQETMQKIVPRQPNSHKFIRNYRLLMSKIRFSYKNT